MESKRRDRLVFDIDAELLGSIKTRSTELGIRPRAFCLDAIRRALRPHVTLDVPAALNQQIIERSQSLGISAEGFSINAIENALLPIPASFTFHTPPSRSREPFEPFVEQANEIIMIGTTFTTLWEPNVAAFLEKKIREQHVPMTFFIIDPDLADENLVFHLLSQRYHQLLGMDLREGIRTIIGVLTRLYKAGQEVNVPVRVLGLQEYPTLGMTICDPLTRSCIIRVVLHLHMYRNEAHPFFDIDARSEEGRIACEALIRHYIHLSAAARPLLGLPLTDSRPIPHGEL